MTSIKRFEFPLTSKDVIKYERIDGKYCLFHDVEEREREEMDKLQQYFTEVGVKADESDNTANKEYYRGVQDGLIFFMSMKLDQKLKEFSEEDNNSY